MCVATFPVRDDVLEIKFGFDGPTKLWWERTEVVTNPKNRLVSFCVSQEYFMRSCSVSSGPCRSHRGNMEAEAMVLQVDLVSMVTSDGHRQWQQWEGRSLSMRHYNNKGNLKVNRRTNHLKQQIQFSLPFTKYVNIHIIMCNNRFHHSSHITLTIY